MNLDTFHSLRAAGIDVDTAPRRLSEYSYDASNYRVRPSAVVFPRTADDVAAVMRYASAHRVAVTPRGGGTSMAGNAVGDGIVMDLSRRMTDIIAIDELAGEVSVQPGVVLSTLRRVIEERTEGRATFAPDPSSHTRATVGGSIANDACGNHSVKYGRMSDHVLALQLITADGHALTATRTDLVATDPGDSEARARAVALKSSLRSVRREHSSVLRDEFGRIPRQVSGYHLGHLLPENGFNIARALVGSEGSCAVIVGARLRIVPKARFVQLAVVGYPDVVAAARDVPRILEHGPAALEGVGRAIVDTIEGRRGPEAIAVLPPAGTAWLYVEFEGDDREALHETAGRMLDDVRASGRLTSARLIDDATERAALWRIREDGAGLSARLADGTQTWPGWEDSAVAPDDLADYLDEMLALLHTHGLEGVIYGHFGAGCVHMRLDFDLRSESGRGVFTSFMTDAARLVVRHGGSLSGEHGDGRARSALLPLMYSSGALDAFQEFKSAWDPDGILNPAAIAHPAPIDADLALRPRTTGVRPRHSEPFAILADEAHRCIGVGRCRSDSGGVMCPSFRATKDEKDSTRGRARVLQDMAEGARSSKEGWRSPEVRDALDLCLSCKACSHDCPVEVDMASYKSQFLDHHYKGRLRPVSHYSLGWLPRWLKLTGLVAPIVNAVLHSPLGPLVARLGGIARERTLPRFHSASAWKGPRTGSVPDADVVLLVDTFTRAFRPHLADDAALVLEATGAAVECNADACCGLTWISTGQLSTARRLLERAARLLDDGTDRPIVVIEPSCAAALKKDLPELVPTDAARRVSRRVHSFADEMRARVDRGWRPPSRLPTTVTVQTHCHEYAVFGSEVQRTLLRQLGVEEVREATGCCGVAGNFGFEQSHYELSMQVAEQALAPALRAGGPEEIVLTDGFSCHMQVAQLDETRTSSHLAQLLASLIVAD